MPSQFTFRPKVQARPSPMDRCQAAALRVAACKATANQESFGPKTNLQTVEEELLEAKKRIGELEAANTKLQAEVDDLRTQVFRFESIKGEGAQLQFFTGLSKDMWSTLWDFLKPTRENLLSASSAAAEAGGRVNAPGAGRPPTLSMEDELLMTLMRIRLATEEQDLAYHFGVEKPFDCVAYHQHVDKLPLPATRAHPHLAQMARRRRNDASLIQGDVSINLCRH